MFYNCIETTNTLQGRLAISNVGIFYITFDNLHDKDSSNFQKVHLVAVVNSLDLNKYGFDIILSKITDDIKILETTGILLKSKVRQQFKYLEPSVNFVGIVQQQIKFLVLILVRRRTFVQFATVTNQKEVHTTWNPRSFCVTKNCIVLT